jgi:hypothetical protein
MASMLAANPDLARPPASRALVPHTPRPLPRVAEIVATAEVLRDHQPRTGFQGRPDRHEDRRHEHSLESGPSRRELPRGPRAPAPAVQGRGLPAGTPATFMAQVLGQTGDRTEGSVVREHRDGPALGSTAYRRAGGEPAIFPSDATLLRLAV